MFKIEKPGLYLDVPVDDYFADPLPAPSLTQSIAKIILDHSPLHAWHAHPRLNPNFVRDDPTKFDIGIGRRFFASNGRVHKQIDCQ